MIRPDETSERPLEPEQSGPIESDEGAKREAYEPPIILKKHSVRRVTLFTGGGALGGGVGGSGP